jgi:hypothetical protein
LKCNRKIGLNNSRSIGAGLGYIFFVHQSPARYAVIDF